jgi:phage recombination protein Bet
MAKKKLSDLPITSRVIRQGVEQGKITDVIAGNIYVNCVSDELPIPDQDIARFFHQIIRTGLDPLSNQIYITPRGGRGSVQTGIDGLRLIADRTGQYIGSTDPIYDGDLTQYAFKQTGRKNPTTATVTVKKLIGTVVGDFTSTAEWDAYNVPGSFWKKMPLLMLAKCAEALALRKAFPNETSGLYISEEMNQAGQSDDGSAEKELLKAVGFQSERALVVDEKLRDAGIDPDDERIVAFLGSTLPLLSASEENDGILKTVWTLAKEVKNGKNAEELLNGLNS